MMGAPIVQPGKKRGGFFWIAVVVAIFVFLAVLGTIVGPPPPTERAPTTSPTTTEKFSPPPAAPIGSPLKIPGPSMVKYNLLTPGTTYAEAVEIMGEEGREISRSDLAGVTTVMFSWEGRLGANLNAMFQDGKLVSKAQFGLK